MTLRYENVSYAYPGAATGVFDISLEIGRGELLAIIGASGSGKSTILKLLAGFVKPASGRILIDGQDVGALAPEARQLGVVFQNYALFPHMRLWENVAYPLKVRGVAVQARRARAVEMLERVGMGARADDVPAALSGGQQQRVALARAFVTRPSLLFADEPTGNLDTHTGQAIIELLFQLNADAGTTLILVTHDDHLAERCHRRIRLDSGRLVRS